MSDTYSDALAFSVTFPEPDIQPLAVTSSNAVTRVHANDNPLCTCNPFLIACSDPDCAKCRADAKRIADLYADDDPTADTDY